MIDCVLTAGGIPEPNDPLYPFSQGKPKTLIDIAGKPMVQWVVDALTRTPDIRHIVVVGLTSEAELVSSKIAHYHADQGSLLRNGLAGIEWLLDHRHSAQQTLVSCADIPLLRPEMVTWLIQRYQNTPSDLNYTVIPRDTMKSAFPTSDRTYVRFSNMAVAGGDIHIANPHIFQSHQNLWRDLSASRKDALKAAMRLGPSIFLKFFLRRLSTGELEKRVQRKLALRLRVLPSPYPEMGMDIDKVHQLEICRRVLEGMS